MTRYGRRSVCRRRIRRFRYVRLVPQRLISVACKSSRMRRAENAGGTSTLPLWTCRAPKFLSLAIKACASHAYGFHQRTRSTLRRPSKHTLIMSSASPTDLDPGSQIYPALHVNLPPLICLPSAPVDIYYSTLLKQFSGQHTTIVPAKNTKGRYPCNECNKTYKTDRNCNVI
jgi:hypothetical protein